MNALEQYRMGAKLDAALAHAGLEVCRGVTSGGNRSGWEPVSGVALLGRILQMGLAVRDAGQSDPRQTTLELVRDNDGMVAHDDEEDVTE